MERWRWWWLGDERGFKSNDWTGLQQQVQLVRAACYLFDTCTTCNWPGSHSSTLEVNCNRLPGWLVGCWAGDAFRNVDLGMGWLFGIIIIIVIGQQHQWLTVVVFQVISLCSCSPGWINVWYSCNFCQLVRVPICHPLPSSSWQMRLLSLVSQTTILLPHPHCTTIFINLPT